MNRIGTAKHKRGFRVVVQPDRVAFGLILDETDGRSDEGSLVARVDADHAAVVLPAVMDAVRASGHARTVLGPQRRAPIVLTEEAGVRLALALIATERVTKPRRLDAILVGVADMAPEEAYYWYAKCMGPDGGRVRKALRLFLAEDR